MTTKIVGMESLERKLNMLKNPYRPTMRGMNKYVRHVQPRAKKYAPLSAANRPPPPFYIRGRGTQLASGKVNLTSQDMSSKWKFEVKRIGTVIRGVIENLADYSGFVIGEKQTWYHRLRGWVNVPDVVDSTSKIAVKFIGDEIDKELNR